MAVVCGDPFCVVCLGGRTFVADWGKMVDIMKAGIGGATVAAMIPSYRRRPPSTGKFKHVDRTSNNQRNRITSMEKKFTAMAMTNDQFGTKIDDKFQTVRDWQTKVTDILLSHGSRLAKTEDTKEDYKDVLDRLDELAAAVEALENL